MIYRSYNILPELPQGATILNPARGWVSVVVPEATANLVLNPSLETDSSGYTISDFTVAASRVTTQQRRGAYSLQVLPAAGLNNGVFYGSVSLTTGSTYTFSADVLGQAGVSYQIWFGSTAAALLGSPFVWTASGQWERVSVTYTETSTTTRRLYLTKYNNSNSGAFYVDGLQLEAKAYPTTYCDGDISGFVPGEAPSPYQWLGTPHASQSTRSAGTRSGGRVINLQNTLGLLITAMMGLGLAVPNNAAIETALLDGSQYQRTTLNTRQFTIAGRIDAAQPAAYQRKLRDLHAALNIDSTPQRQPMLLKYQAHDCLRPMGEELDIPCVYQGGLDGGIENLFGQQTPITFTTYLPAIERSGDSGASVVSQTTVANANCIIRRAPDGTWSALGTGLSSQTVAVAYGRNGVVYAGGYFTTASGSTVNYVAGWNPVTSTWSTLGPGPGLGTPVLALAIGANGYVYAGTLGGIVSFYDGVSWTSIGNTGGSTIYALAVGPDGRIYAGGSFTTISATPANRIAVYNPATATWSAIGTGLNAPVHALTFGPDGRMYIGGEFTTANSSSANRIVALDTTTGVWNTLGSGLSNDVYAVTFANNGTLYVGGNFLTAGGITARGIASWNGVAYSALGTGLTDTVLVIVNTILALPEGGVLVGGRFTTANGIALSDSLAAWNNGTWRGYEVDLPGAAIISALSRASDGTLYIGYQTSGSATASSVTIVTNVGTAQVYPTIKISGPSSGTSRVYQIANTSTGKSVYLNLTLQVGETATLVTLPDGISFTSSVQGNIINTILPGSQVAEMYLLPGSNTINAFAASSTVTITMQWTAAYQSVVDANY